MPPARPFLLGALLGALLLAACSADPQPVPPPPPPAVPPAVADAPPTNQPATEPASAGDLRTRAESLAADVRTGARSSCDAAADLYSLARDAQDPHAFIALRSDVLAGLRPSLIAGGDGSEVQGFDDSGFRPEFRDGSNQVRHLAAAIQAGVTLGPAAAVLHRVLRPDSPQDEALNDVGTILGAQIASGEIPLAQAGVQIRATICE